MLYQVIVGTIYDRCYSNQRNNELHQSPSSNRQPITTRVTERTQSKKNVIEHRSGALTK